MAFGPNPDGLAGDTENWSSSFLFVAAQSVKDTVVLNEQRRVCH